MKKQLLFVVAVLGVQQSQAISSALMGLATGKDVKHVQNINYIPQIPATVNVGEVYSVNCNDDINGKPVLEKGDSDGVTLRRHQWGNKRCKITFNKPGKYVITQMVDGKKQFQHISAVEVKKEKRKKSE